MDAQAQPFCPSLPVLPFFAAGGGGGGGCSGGGGGPFEIAYAAAAAAIGPVQATLSALQASLAELTRRSDLSDFQRLFIQPTASTGVSVRSPVEDERVNLKRRVIEFYGLADPDNNGRSFTHVGGPSVEYKYATLAHIWPSGAADTAGLLQHALRLSEAFHINPRNFLVILDDVHRAFDSVSLLLLPLKAKDGGLSRVVVRT